MIFAKKDFYVKICPTGSSPFLTQKERYAGGAPAQSGCFQHQQLRLSYVCTSATAAFAFDAFDAYGVSGFTRSWTPASSRSRHSFCTLLRRKYLGRRLHSRDEISLPLNYTTTYLAYYLSINNCKWAKNLTKSSFLLLNLNSGLDKKCIRFPECTFLSS